MRGGNRNGIGDTLRYGSGDLDGRGRCGFNMVVDAGASQARFCTLGEREHNVQLEKERQLKEGKASRKKARSVCVRVLRGLSRK
jgi:hypothetical protein